MFKQLRSSQLAQRPGVAAHDLASEAQGLVVVHHADEHSTDGLAVGAESADRRGPFVQGALTIAEGRSASATSTSRRRF